MSESENGNSNLTATVTEAPAPEPFAAPPQNAKQFVFAVTGATLDDLASKIEGWLEENGTWGITFVAYQCNPQNPTYGSQSTHNALILAQK